MFQDVQFTGAGVTLKLRCSKTDQFYRGNIIKLGFCSLGDLCPVLALQKYVSVCGPTPGLLFRHMDGTPLTRHQFWAVTSKALSFLGLAHFRFGTHSFRIGAASTAASLGYPASMIQKMGCWQSKVYQSYVRS